MIKKILFALVVTSSLVFSYSMDYDKDTLGLVRKIKVAKEPQWVSKIELTNGKKLFFCSPKSMIEFYQQPGKWDHIGVKNENDFKDLIVTDFKTKKPIDALGAFYIYGTNVISPAGDDLIPFATYKDAKEFSKVNRGMRIFSFKEISPALIKLINGRI